jgi:hypothetical protein
VLRQTLLHGIRTHVRAPHTAPLEDLLQTEGLSHWQGLPRPPTWASNTVCFYLSPQLLRSAIVHGITLNNLILFPQAFCSWF